MAAEIIRQGALSVQVCVPKDWTDEQVVAFTEAEYPCGTEHGWSIRKEGSALLGGDPERRQCAEHQSNVHIVLDA